MRRRVAGIRVCAAMGICCNRYDLDRYAGEQRVKNSKEVESSDIVSLFLKL